MNRRELSPPRHAELVSASPFSTARSNTQYPYALHFRNVNGLTLDDIRITYNPENPSPNWKDALQFENTNQVMMNRIDIKK